MAVAQALEQLIADPAHAQHIVQRDVAMLASDWGAKDEDAFIHTLGINLLGSMGKAAGYMSLIEYPVPRAQRWQKKLVRVDAAGLTPIHANLLYWWSSSGFPWTQCLR